MNQPRPKLLALLTACAGMFASHHPLLAQCTDTWTTVAPLPDPRDQTCSAVVNGKIYVFGSHNHSFSGAVPNDRAEVYDPQTNTWTRLDDMPTGRGMAAAAAVNGLIYVIGGNNSFSNNWLQTVEAYDPATNNWTTKASLPNTGCGSGGRGLLAAAAVDGHIYVFGGADSYCQPSALEHVDRYDPATDTWTPNITTLPRKRGHHGAAVVNGKVYIVAGWSDTAGGEHMVPETDVYDPATNSWSLAAPIPTVRALLEVVERNGRIIAIGGTVLPGSEINYLTAVEEFNPQTNQWQSLTSLPAGQGWGSAAVAGGKLYVIGGGIDTGAFSSIVYQSASSGNPADVNGDGVVNSADIVLVAQSIGQTCQCPEDVDGNGIVNARDVVAVAHQMGWSCP